MGGDHKCPVCQATFTRPQHVARHMRSHTGDRPYKCQFCGDQFARSDLLSRHVNKCHASEKPLPSTGSTRRKGSASASRATTSKQACDQCVQSSLPCDGSNPCSKCVQRKCRCTYVKFHRQTAPAGPGHHSARPAAVDPSSMSISGMPMSSALALSSGLGGMSSSIPGASSSRIPLYHPTISADDDFILGPPPPLPGPSSHHHGHAAPSTTRGNNGIPTMAETLYGSNSFDFPPLYPPTAGTGTAGSVGSTSSDGGDVDSDYVAAVKYRVQVQAELFGAGRTTGGLGYDPRPSSSSTASSVTGHNNPQGWLGWDHHPHPHQNPQIRHADAFPQQHPHQQQHSGSQRISSQPVDLSGSGGVDGGLGGGGLGIGANVGSSLHDNPSHFMHAARRSRGPHHASPISQAQAHGQTPPPPPAPPHSQRVDVHEGLDLRLGGMGGPTHPHGHGPPLSMVGGTGMGSGADMDGMGGLAMSMPMPMPSSALGMNLGLGGFVDVGGGAGGAGGGVSGGEEDVDVGMMLGMGMYAKYGGGNNTGRYHDIDRAATASTSTTASSESSRSSHHGHGHHQQQRGDDSDDMKHGKQRYHVAVGATDDERRKERQEFNNAFGLMSLDDPNVGGGIEPDGEAFFSDPAQAHNRDPAGSGSTRTTTTTTTSSSSIESRGRPHTASDTNANTNAADMDTPMPMKRTSGGLLHFSSAAPLSTPSREGEAKELREFWRAYMHTPLSDSGGGESGKDSSKGTPLAASGGGAGGYRKRVASLPSSKTPIVERDMGDMGMMYGGGEQSLVYPGLGGMRAGAGVQHHGNDHREDLRSYEAAVMARKAPTTLNLKPRMARGRGGDANRGPSSSTQKTPLSHASSASSLANPSFVGQNLPHTSSAHVRTTHEGSASPSIPSSSSPSRSSSCVVEDASDTTDSLRPSFKRLPSQTLGPSNAKRAYLGRGGASSTSTLGGGGGMNMGGFEGNAVVDLDGGDDRYHNPHMQESAVVGMSGLSHPDRVVKSLAERRKRKRRMSAPTSGSGAVGLGLVEGIGGEGGEEK